MNFVNAFLGPRSIQVCHLRSKTSLTSVDCLCGPPRPIQRGHWAPRWLAPFSPAPTRQPGPREARWAAGAVAAGGRRDERPARRCGRPGRGQPARRWRSGGVDGGGLELSRSPSSVSQQGLELRAARAMAELARAGAGRAQVVVEEQGPTPDGPSLPTPSPSPTAAYRRSRAPGRALFGSAPLKLRSGDDEPRRPSSTSLLWRTLLRPRAPRDHVAIPCSLRRARCGPAPPASSGLWASSSPSVGSARLGADPSGSNG